MTDTAQRLQQNYLIVDQGGTSSRAMVFGPRGQMLDLQREPVTTERPHAGWVEQSPEAMVASIEAVVKRALGSISARHKSWLRAVGLVTQRSSLVCWDRHSGEALSPILSWQDTRASQWLQDQDFNLADMHRRTGLFLNAHFGASKMRWCLDHLEPVQTAAAAGRLCMAPLASYLIFKLVAGAPYMVDPANASRTLLMNVTTRDWDDDLLSQFGIDRAYLPDIVSSTADFGLIKPAISGPAPLALQLVNGDQSAAAFAMGEPDNSSVYINIGTGAFIYRRIEQPVLGGRLLSSIVYWQDKHKAPYYVEEGTVNGAGAALSWYAGQLGVPNATRWIIEQLNALKDIVRSEVPIFINGIGGLGSPYWQADFSSYFIGEGGQQKKFIAVVESIIFLLYRNLLLMEPQGKIFDRIVVSGGLANSDFICQSLADLSGLPVVRVEECEASARGAAYLLAAGPIDWAVLKQQIFQPVPIENNGQSTITQRFEQWQQQMEIAVAAKV